jgi:hypothetical protein
MGTGRTIKARGASGASMTSRAIMSAVCWLAAVGVFVLTFAGPDYLVAFLEKAAVFALCGLAALAGAGIIVSAVAHSSRPWWPR